MYTQNSDRWWDQEIGEVKEDATWECYGYFGSPHKHTIKATLKNSIGEELASASIHSVTI